jgi:hypothetical protein
MNVLLAAVLYDLEINAYGKDIGHQRLLLGYRAGGSSHHDLEVQIAFSADHSSAVSSGGPLAG